MTNKIGMYTMYSMDNFNFMITDDGSVGLYDNITKDIFHSVTGAWRESCDKFIYPTGFIEFCKHNSKINILDICFGIGYNFKSALFFALKNSKNINIKITSLEISKEVAFLSPFIKDSVPTPDINIYLLSYFLSNEPNYLDFIGSYIKLNADIVDNYFSDDIMRLFAQYSQLDMSNYPQNDLYAFLHNIYYQNISNSMESVLKPSKCKNVSFDLIFDDARQSVQTLKSMYDFVFLDAFTPHKQPLLWTYDFLSVVKSIMSNKSILSTYSNSTPVRKTLLDLGFYVGKIILDNSQFGTIASFDNNKIISELTEYDYGLMYTKAGIPYRDNNFQLTSSQILINRENELKNCDIMSASEYKRKFKNDINI